MSIQLDPGFICKVEVKNSKGSILYNETCSLTEDIDNFINQYGKSKPGWSLIRGALLPLRTKNVRDFSKDFFLPTFVNFALKVNNIALKVLASIFAIAFDVITFPIRLLVTPVRAIYNYRKSDDKHPLISLIEQTNKNNSVNEDILTINYIKEEIELKKSNSECKIPFAHKSSTKGVVRVALKRLPGGIKNKKEERTETVSYAKALGEWVEVARSSGGSKQTNFAF